MFLTIYPPTALFPVETFLSNIHSDLINRLFWIHFFHVILQALLGLITNQLVISYHQDANFLPSYLIIDILVFSVSVLERNKVLIVLGDFNINWLENMHYVTKLKKVVN